jgi:hypothetical protein
MSGAHSQVQPLTACPLSIAVALLSPPVEWTDDRPREPGYADGMNYDGATLDTSHRSRRTRARWAQRAGQTCTSRT